MWNSMDVGSKRDFLGSGCFRCEYELFAAELSAAFKAYKHIEWGVYFSQFEWFNPLYLEDQRANFSTQQYSQVSVRGSVIAHCVYSK
jgi:alpha-L-fucosidase